MEKQVKKEKPPDCYKCSHRRELPGSCHSRCNNHKAKVSGNITGIRCGWFMWPLNFDPTWLEICDGFTTDEEAKNAPIIRLDPLTEIFAILR